MNHAQKKTWSRPEVTSEMDPFFLTPLEKNADVDRQGKKQRTTRKLFSCRFCGYVTNRKGNRDTHLRTHSGERPYKCRFCNYAAAYRSSVVVHERRHTGERPYRCPACTYSALQKTSLNQHMLKHHPSHWHRLMAKTGRADRQTTPWCETMQPTTNADSMASAYTEVGRMGAFVSEEPDEVNQRKDEPSTETTKDENDSIAIKDGDCSLNSSLDFSKKEGQVPLRPSVIRKVEDSGLKVGTPTQGQGCVVLTIPSVRSRLFSHSSYNTTSDHRHHLKQNQVHVENCSSEKVIRIIDVERPFQSSHSASADVQKMTGPTGDATRTEATRSSSGPGQQQLDNFDSSTNENNVYPRIKIREQNVPNGFKTRTTDALRLEDAPITSPANIATGDIAPTYDTVTTEETKMRNEPEELFNPNLYEQRLNEGHHHISQGFYGCYYCGIIFTDKIMHDIHVSYHGHQDPFRCNMCGLLCPDRYAFYLHLHKIIHR
ncbi:uncharacterized protein LOC144862257 [Branchiostoma floridae x Branchiostoma japonicum]